MIMRDLFQAHQLDDEHVVLEGRLPDSLLPAPNQFEHLWERHPTERPTIRMFGRDVQIPRWQKAFGADYEFSGQKSHADEIPDILEPYLRWARETIEQFLNGILMNFYEEGHYIGPHQDDTRQLIQGTPIVTISLGEERIFRLTQKKKKLKHDLVAGNGTVLVLPWATNKTWHHEVPHFKRYRERRISITLRAFQTAVTTSATQTAAAEKPSPATVRDPGHPTVSEASAPQSSPGSATTQRLSVSLLADSPPMLCGNVQRHHDILAPSMNDLHSSGRLSQLP